MTTVVTPARNIVLTDRDKLVLRKRMQEKLLTEAEMRLKLKKRFKK